jgi:hypothetical protein
VRALRKWWLKAGVQGVVSLLPERASEAVNGKLQVLGSGGVALRDATITHKVEQSNHHMAAWEQFRAKDGAPPRVLEVGTGWFPLVPLLMYASGADLVQSFDVRQLTTPARIRAAAAAVASRGESLSERATADRIDRLRALGDATDAELGERLREMRVSFHTGRVSSSSVTADSFDLAISDNTLEHIPARQIHELCVALAGAIGTGGVIDHYVDASDHYAHFDRSITEYNFLRWDDRAWKLINNRLLYQNRLRQGDYTAALERAGLRVVASEWTPGRPQEVASLQLAPRFRDRAVDDLAPLRGYVTAAVD